MTQRYEVRIEDKLYEVTEEKKAYIYMREYGLDKYVVYGTVLCLGKHILKLAHGKTFIIIDKALRIALVCEVDQFMNIVFINDITDIDKVHVKDGMKIDQFTEVFENN